MSEVPMTRPPDSEKGALAGALFQSKPSDDNQKHKAPAPAVQESRLKLGEWERERIEIIDIPTRLRHPTDQQIADMAESMRRHGLLTPILLRVAVTETDAGLPRLVAGLTRLLAAKRLGWERIDAQYVEGTERDFRVAEIIENLHRAELTAQQRADWTAELVKLCAEEEVAQVGPPGRYEKRGVREAARELNLPRSSVQRDLKIAGISPEAKEAIRAAGLDDNQSAQLEVANQPTPEAQVEKVRQIVAAKAKPAKKAPQIEITPDSVTVEETDDDDEPGVEDEILPENYRTAFLLRADQAVHFAAYSGPVAQDIVDAAFGVVNAWGDLAERMIVAKPETVEWASMISPLDRCCMHVRSSVLNFMRATPPEKYGDLIAELRGELDDLEKVAERRRGELAGGG
jgi:ParB family chromosome partitioning protein